MQARPLLSGGLLAPVAVPAGWLMIAHGGDNFIAGCNQFITGRTHAPLTVQLMEKVGMSNDTASLVNNTLMLVGATLACTTINSGSKMGTGLSSVIRPETSISMNIPKEGVRQIWSQTKNRTSVQNAYKHWKDHGHEFSDIQNAKQYVEKAHNFFRDPSALSRMRPDGCLLRYDPSTNVFGSYSSSGVPKTIFKPGISKPLPSRYLTPLEYFYGQ